MKNKIIQFLHVLNEYRLYSKNYVNMSYFFVFTFFILILSDRIDAIQNVQLQALFTVISFLVLILLPLAGLYYIVEMIRSICRINKGQKSTEKNKHVIVSDIIYILFLIGLL